MGKKTTGSYYAVARGKQVGIFRTWDDCSAQVKGFPNARFKKFETSDEAQAFINEHKGTTGVPSFPVGNSSKASGQVGQGQKRHLSSSSSLKVTEERVISKRAKTDSAPANSNVDLKSFTVDESGFVVVYTDGACTKNGKRGAKAGIGVWFGRGHLLNISEPVDGRQTNNTAEIQAAERAINQAKSHGINKLNVKTDSQFTINCVTKWLNSWKRNNWRLSSGGEVKNKEDLIKLEEAMQNMEIKWSYVAGHRGVEGNEAADRLAVAGANKSV